MAVAPVCYRAALVQRFPGLSLLVALSAALASCAAPLDEGRPCSAADAPPIAADSASADKADAGAPASAICDQGKICVAGRCRAQDVATAPADSVRHVLAPIDIAVIASRGAGGGGDNLPDVVALGKDDGGTVVMLLRFAAAWRDDAEITSAFLVLDTSPGAPPPASAIRFEMARILEAWEPAIVSWGRQPRLGVPRVAGSARARPALPLRVDVTPLVREWAKRAADDHGIALLATGSDAYGAVVSTGASQGIGPRLEVYVK